MVHYVIKDLISNGYYNGYYNGKDTISNFSGIIYANKYPNKDLAKSVINNLLLYNSNLVLIIIKIYVL